MARIPSASMEIIYPQSTGLCRFRRSLAQGWMAAGPEAKECRPSTDLGDSHGTKGVENFRPPLWKATKAWMVESRHAPELSPKMNGE